MLFGISFFILIMSFMNSEMYIKNFKLKNIYLGFITIILIVLFGLRGDFTTDYRSYYDMFLIYGKATWRQCIKAREILYALLNKICSIFFDDFYVFLLVIGMMMMFFYYKRIKEDSKNFLISLLIFVILDNYFISFNAMRNILAVAGVFYFSKYIWEEKPWKYIVAILILSEIHTSALIMLPMYWILKINFKREKTFFLLAAILAMVLLVSQTQSIVLMVQKLLGYNYIKGDFGIAKGVFGSF